MDGVDRGKRRFLAFYCQRQAFLRRRKAFRGELIGREESILLGTPFVDAITSPASVFLFRVWNRDTCLDTRPGSYPQMIVFLFRGPTANLYRPGLRPRGGFVDIEERHPLVHPVAAIWGGFSVQEKLSWVPKGPRLSTRSREAGGWGGKRWTGRNNVTLLNNACGS